MRNDHIVFVSTMSGWPATEELWWRTAVNLARQGWSISASVVGDQPDHPTVKILRKAGVRTQLRPARYALWRRAWHRLRSRGKSRIEVEIEKLIERPPALIVFSEAYPFPPIELLELCISRKLPFATIANGNEEHYWPNDDLAKRYRDALLMARKCYFVARANLRLAEKEIGCALPNGEVVWSQFNVNFNASPPWPHDQKQLRMACVGRLHPAHKGQDILFEALANPVWESRDWHLTLYGNGPMRDTLERYAARLRLSQRVTFAGHVAVEEIWSANHVLVMPSRCEGMPLVIVEAMLCGRPVFATDVGGISEAVVDGSTGLIAGPAAVAPVAQGLERLWANRGNLEAMGKAGARRIRELVPPDPIMVFTEKLKALI